MIVSSSSQVSIPSLQTKLYMLYEPSLHHHENSKNQEKVIGDEDITKFVIEYMIFATHFHNSHTFFGSVTQSALLLGVASCNCSFSLDGKDHLIVEMGSVVHCMTGPLDQ